ncbi:MAG: hypothetical protein ACKVQW_07215 [Pyrinomonadaceae bacterium]
MDYLTKFNVRTCFAFPALIGLLILNVSSCAQSAKNEEVNRILSELDNGKVVGNVYENKLLGLKIPFPKSMSPDTKTEMEPYVKEAIEKFKQGRPEDKKIVDEMIRKDRVVFSLDMSATEESLGAAMTLTLKKDETGEELRGMVERTIKYFTESGKQKLVEKVSERNIGAINAFTFLMSQELEGVTVFSKIYTGRRNGYFFTLSGSYADKIGQSEMEAVIKGIEAK